MDERTRAYNAVRGDDTTTAGLIDLTDYGRIAVGGAEAVMFLNGLLTNDVKTLADGAVMLAALPNAQGRLQAFVTVARNGGEFYFTTESATHQTVLKNLERFTLAGDFRVTDYTDATAHFLLQGAGAAAIVERVFGAEAAQIGKDALSVVRRSQINAEELIIARTTQAGADSFSLICARANAPLVSDALLTAGATKIDAETSEILRIEAGAPRFGVDVDETNVVLEAGQMDTVSFNKGCYIGQEIIARIHWRGHVAKQLAGIVFDDEPVMTITAGDKIFSAADKKEAGRITSTAYSSQLQRTVALGIVRYAYLAPGTAVKVEHEAQLHAAHIAALPLIQSTVAENTETQE